MSNNRIDETGNKYGLLTVIKYAYTKNKRAYWLCKCECGNFVIVKGKYLRNGDTKSCGCLYINSAMEMGKSNKKQMNIILTNRALFMLNYKIIKKCYAI